MHLLVCKYELLVVRPTLSLLWVRGFQHAECSESSDHGDNRCWEWETWSVQNIDVCCNLLEWVLWQSGLKHPATVCSSWLFSIPKLQLRITWIFNLFWNIRIKKFFNVKYGHRFDWLSYAYNKIKHYVKEAIRLRNHLTCSSFLWKNIGFWNQ